MYAWMNHGISDAISVKGLVKHYILEYHVNDGGFYADTSLLWIRVIKAVPNGQFLKLWQSVAWI